MEVRLSLAAVYPAAPALRAAWPYPTRLTLTGAFGSRYTFPSRGFARYRLRREAQGFTVFTGFILDHIFDFIPALDLLL